MLAKMHVDKEIFRYVAIYYGNLWNIFNVIDPLLFKKRKWMEILERKGKREEEKGRRKRR